MQAITIKMEDRLLEELDQKLEEHRYSTRTEFIRDAIREKLSELEKIIGKAKAQIVFEYFKMHS